jgi:hypothetical protein
MKIQIYIVFHKEIFDDCYKNIPDSILLEYFTFIAVNESIPKKYTKNKYKIINEWELPIYDSNFQTRGYNENSAIYHIYINNLHKNYDLIGFFQYDMVFNNNIIDYILNKNNNNNNLYALLTLDFNTCSQTHFHYNMSTCDFLIREYEQYFNTIFSKNKQYPMCNTFIIPIKNYEDIMLWVISLYEKLYPWACEEPNYTGIGAIGGVFERVMAFVLGEQNLNLIYIDGYHDHEYKKYVY